jgi:hypothetical protein
LSPPEPSNEGAPPVLKSAPPGDLESLPLGSEGKSTTDATAESKGPFEASRRSVIIGHVPTAKEKLGAQISHQSKGPSHKTNYAPAPPRPTIVLRPIRREGIQKEKERERTTRYALRYGHKSVTPLARLWHACNHIGSPHRVRDRAKFDLMIFFSG